MTIVLDSKLSISYSQIAIFDVDTVDPFNDWNRRHVQQGFAWRPGSVSFGTLFESGELLIRVYLGAGQTLAEAGSLRGWQVPFAVGSSGRVEFSSISASALCDIGSGSYALSCFMGGDEDSAWCSIHMTPEEDCDPRVLVHDGALCPVYPLLMEARPAN